VTFLEELRLKKLNNCSELHEFKGVVCKLILLQDKNKKQNNKTTILKIALKTTFYIANNVL